MEDVGGRSQGFSERVTWHTVRGRFCLACASGAASMHLYLPTCVSVPTGAVNRSARVSGTGALGSETAPHFSTCISPSSSSFLTCLHSDVSIFLRGDRPQPSEEETGRAF